MSTHQTRHETFTASDFYSLTSFLSDTVDLPRPVRAIAVGTAGEIVCENDKGNPVIIRVVAGQILPIQTKHIWSTGTTATALVGLV